MTVNHDVTGSSPVGGAKKNTHYQQLVLMTQGVHPFPYRTRKLSPVVPKIVPWRRGVKIGRCQHLIVSISLCKTALRFYEPYSCVLQCVYGMGEYGLRTCCTASLFFVYDGHINALW